MTKKRGRAPNQAIGRSRGGRTARIHAPTDSDCRPVAFLPTPAAKAADRKATDRKAADILLEHCPAAILAGDKGYDGNSIRRKVEDRGAMPNIPPKAAAPGRTTSRPSFAATAMSSPVLYLPAVRSNSTAGCGCSILLRRRVRASDIN